MADADLKVSLQNYLDRHGGHGAVQGDVLAIPEGHAGLAYAFSLVGNDGAKSDYVLKLAPVGVRRSGSADVYRQYPLLRILKGLDLPVPAVPWASPEEQWLGTPFIIMERLPGRSLIVWKPDMAGDLRSHWIEAARLLARFHGEVSAHALAAWEQSTNLSADLERWARIIRHSARAENRSAAEALFGQLADAMPDAGKIGLVHGDFQPGNILYIDRRAAALIDWDLAAVGPVMIDLGWLLMMADGGAWAPEWQPGSPPSAQEIVQGYRDAGGESIRNLEWFQAFACFRMAVITGMNVKLHREGRRHDPIWDNFDSSASTLLARGRALLNDKKGRTP